MIPVVWALENSGIFRPVIASTGQHGAMLDNLFEDTGVYRDMDLRVREHSRTLNQTFAHVMLGLDEVFETGQIPPQFHSTGHRDATGLAAALVHGDTTTAAAAAMSAFHRRIPVFHVEAGLRTSNVLSPFPEEGNRQVISRLAALHLAPTSTAKANLVRERVNPDRIVVTGNTSIDMLGWALAHPEQYPPELRILQEQPDRPVMLVTTHRRENWGAGIDGVARAVVALTQDYPDLLVVLPMHPNPAVRATLTARLAGNPQVLLTEPLDYVPFTHVMQRALVVLTDSGGVQEEAPSLGTPVLVARDTTERTEGIEAGTLELVGTDPARIRAAVHRLLDHPEELAARSHLANPYGDGHAAERIAQALACVFTDAPAPREFGEWTLRAAVLRRLGQSYSPALTPAPPCPA